MVRAISRMNGIEEYETQRAEKDDRQPGRQSGRDGFAIAQVLAGEDGTKKGCTHHQAEGSADEYVAVLIVEDERKAHENQQ